MRERSRYDINNAAYKIEGYFLRRPLDSEQIAFESAKQECLIHMERAIEDVRELTLEQFQWSKRKGFNG